MVWERLRDSAAVATFLNTQDDALGGRPIDIATGSDAGLTAVIAHLDATRAVG